MTLLYLTLHDDGQPLPDGLKADLDKATLPDAGQGGVETWVRLSMLTALLEGSGCEAAFSTEPWAAVDYEWFGKEGEAVEDTVSVDMHQRAAGSIATLAMEQGREVTLTPLPFDNMRVTLKNESRAKELLEQTAASWPINPDPGDGDEPEVTR